MENQKSQLPEEPAEVQPGRGAIVHGNVQTDGGDFVGRDRVVHGDEVSGDKFEIGEIEVQIPWSRIAAAIIGVAVVIAILLFFMLRPEPTALEITEPEEDAVYAVGSKLDFKGQGKANATVEVEVTKNGESTPVFVRSQKMEGDVWEFGIPAGQIASAGDYTFSVAIKGQGKRSGDLLLVDAPSILHPLEGEAIDPNKGLTVNGERTPGSAVRLLENGVPRGNDPAGSSKWEVPLGSLDNTQRNLVLTVEVVDGDKVIASSTRTVWNWLPTLEKPQVEPVIAGEVELLGSWVSNALVNIRADGELLTQEPVRVQEGLWTWKEAQTFQEPGEYVISLQGIDSYGNRLDYAPVKNLEIVCMRGMISDGGSKTATSSCDGRQTEVRDAQGNELSSWTASPSGPRVSAAASLGADDDVILGFDNGAHCTGLEDCNPEAEAEPLEGRINAIAASPDGGGYALASEAGEVRVYVEERAEPLSLTGHTAAVNDVNYNPSGDLLVTASDDQTARVWRLDGAGEPIVLDGHTAALNAASFSPAGDLIVTASEDDTGRVWDFAGGGDPLVLSGHTGAVNEAAFSPTGERIVTASDDGTARLWDADGNLVAVLDGHTDIVYTARFSPDGQRILTYSRDGTARLWDEDGALIAILRNDDPDNPIYSATFSHDGTRVLTVSRDGDLSQWDLDGNRLNLPTLVVENGYPTTGEALTFSGTGDPGDRLQITLTGPIQRLEGPLTVGDDGTWSTTTTFDKEGDYEGRLQLLGADERPLLETEPVSFIVHHLPALAPPHILFAGRVTLRGVGEPESALEIDISDVDTYKVDVDRSGNWELVTSILKQGVYEVDLHVLDEAGRWLASADPQEIQILKCGRGRIADHIYIVAACETMSGIAKRLGISYQSLLASNPQIADPDDIRPDQRLNIPRR